MKSLLTSLLSLLPLGATAAQLPKDPILFAFYSEDAAKAVGTVIYNTTDGREVVATMVSKNPVPEGYEWEDTVFVDVVTTFVRPGPVFSFFERLP